MTQEPKHVLEFGPFRIEPDERLLRRGSEVIPLSPKAVDTLLVLVSSGGRVVEKDDLIRRVWPNSFVEEGGLARNISLLRKALGSGPNDSMFIETIAKRGYRFTAEVKEVEEIADNALSLAVLPLANLSNDPAQEFFADGMTDELITYLMRIEALRVSSRTSVMAYKGIAKGLREIARELNVHWVVEGTVLQWDGRVRISTRLIEGASEKHSWAAIYEKDMRNVLALQSAVASDIARTIQVKLSSPEKTRLGQFRAIEPKAYEDYLRGRYFWNQRTPEGLRKALDCFQRAIQKDPTYARAHSGLADTFAVLASTGYDMMSPKEAMPLARSAALDAIRLDGELAEAHAALGFVKLVHDWDWAGAEQELSRAIELNPNYATAYQWRGELLMAMNRPEQATEAFQRALALDPLSVAFNLGLGWCYYFSEQYEKAVEQHRRTLELAPNAPMALYGLGMAYLHNRQQDRVLGELLRAFGSLGEEPAALMVLGVTHAFIGMVDLARQDLERLQVMSQHRYVPAVYSAFINIAMNDVDRAFEWLDKACEERSSYLIFLAVQPAMTKLRSDSRYETLLRRIGLA